MKNNTAWIISVDMGYGHQRTAHPLKDFAPGKKVINANNYLGIPLSDKKIWKSARNFYEFVSRFKRIPLIGELSFYLFDKIQQIPAFYPKRNLSKPTFGLKNIFSLIKSGWGKNLIEKLKAKNLEFKTDLPIITTFFTPAFMAEEFNYKGEIYCVICDADISRTWVSLNPQKSRIKYLVPNEWVFNRLKLYGVKEENIFLTGYPLPLNNIGSEKMEVLKNDLKYRLLNLDPKKEYFKKYKILIKSILGELPSKANHPLTIMFSVGGAGAQKEIGVKIVSSLREKIKKGEVRVILSVGIRKEIEKYFLSYISYLKIKDGVEVLFFEDIQDYFEKFNQKLRTTDILWTKPSELSFYTGLGLPIIISPPVGSQEDFNKKWLLSLGSGTLQENPNFTVQWLFDYLFSGRLAEASMQGFMEAEKLGVYNVKKIVFKK